MKLKPTKAQLRNIAIYGAFILADIVFVIYITTPELLKFSRRGNVGYGWHDNLKPIDPPIYYKNIPANQYYELKEKMQKVRQMKNGDYFNGWSIGFNGVIGTGENYECDTCTINYDENFIPGKKIYSLSLQGWKLNSTSLPHPGLDSVIFYVENGQSYIRKSIVSPPFANKDGSTGYQIYEKDIPVKFRYSHNLRWLRIPISKATATILKPIFITLQIMVAIGWLYLIFLFLQFIIDLTKGRTFTEKNIRRLKIIAYCLVAYPAIIILLNLFIRLIFNSYFTSDVVFNTDRLYRWWLIIHVGFIFLLLVNAFIKGKSLQDEQALTV